MLASLGFAGFIVWYTKGAEYRGGHGALRFFGYVLAAFAVLTIIFKPNSDPFLNTIFLGHQVREVFTHVLVTLPLGWAVCLGISGTGRNAGPVAATHVRLAIQAGLVGCALWVYLFLSSLYSDSIVQGQTDNLILLVSPHFFEHAFSYLLVPMVAGLTWQIIGKKELTSFEVNSLQDSG
jgi:hypothetical protein